MDPFFSLDHILRLGQSQRIKPDAVQRYSGNSPYRPYKPLPPPPPTTHAAAIPPRRMRAARKNKQSTCATKNVQYPCLNNARNHLFL